MNDAPTTGLAAAGEATTPPAAIILHDPVAAGAFRAFDAVGDDDRLEDDLLVRARPDA